MPVGNVKPLATALAHGATEIAAKTGPKVAAKAGPKVPPKPGDLMDRLAAMKSAKPSTPMASAASPQTALRFSKLPASASKTGSTSSIEKEGTPAKDTVSSHGPEFKDAFGKARHEEGGNPSVLSHSGEFGNAFKSAANGGPDMAGKAQTPTGAGAPATGKAESTPDSAATGKTDSSPNGAGSQATGKSEGLLGRFGNAVSNAVAPAGAGVEGVAGAALSAVNAVSSHLAPGSTVDTVGQMASDKFSNAKMEAALQEKNDSDINRIRFTSKLEAQESLAETLASMSKKTADFIASMFK